MNDEVELPDVDEDLVDDVDVDLEQEPAPAPAPATTPQINFNDRLYAVGFSQCGKSEVLNVLFSGFRCQRLLIDTKPEFEIPDVEAVHDPAEVDWSEPTIHYQPAPGSDCSQYEELFAGAWATGYIVVFAHEMAALVDYNPNKAGPYLLSYASQGAKRGKGLFCGTQRPFRLPVAALTEANHFMVFAPQLARRDDHNAIAEALSPVDGQRVTPDELAQELAGLQQMHGNYSFLWKDRRAGTLQAFSPLPDSVRRLSIVRRTEDA